MNSLIGLQYYVNQFGDPYPNAVMWGDILRGSWLKQMIAQKRIEDARMFKASGLCFIIKQGEIVKLTQQHVVIYEQS
jgi:hypothetical protein